MKTMRKTAYLVVAVCTLLSWGACSRNGHDVQTVEQTLYAGAPQCRVSLTETYQTVWNAGDRVSVFFLDGSAANEAWDYTGADKAAGGPLSHSGPYHFTSEKVALSPYDAGASWSAGVISTSLPAVQPYVAGSYGAALLTASSSDDQLHFHYATAMVRLTLSGSARIAGVKLRGNASEVLAGPVRIDVSGAEPVLTLAPEADATELTLSGAAVLATLNGDEKDFYLSLPPVTFSAGFVMTVLLANGSEVPVRYTSPVTLAAGDCLCLTQTVREEYVLDVQLAENPQTSASALYSLPTATRMTTSNTIDKVVSMSLNTPYVFQIWAKMGFCKDTANNGAQIVCLDLSPTVEKNGVTYGGTGYAWIKLPAISGMTLTSVHLDMYAAGAAGDRLNISSAVDASGAGNADQCPETAFSKSVELPLSSPSPNTAYYLCTGNQTKTRITAMRLVYIYE